MPIKSIILSFVAVFSFFTLASNAYAQQDTRPGWGFGDQNHVHTGPPGQTVHPVHQNNASLSFAVNASANTGNNNPTIPDEGEKFISIVTGAATTVVSFVASIGHGLFGS